MHRYILRYCAWLFRGVAEGICNHGIAENIYGVHILRVGVVHLTYTT